MEKRTWEETEKEKFARELEKLRGKKRELWTWENYEMKKKRRKPKEKFVGQRKGENWGKKEVNQFY